MLSSSGSSETVEMPSTRAVCEESDLLEAAIALLKERNLFEDDEEMGELQFKRLRDPSQAKKLAPKYEAARTRALRLVSGVLGKDTASPHLPSGAHTFTDDEFPGYGQGDVFPFVRDATTRVQRVQHSGLCYMHAGAVVQYYAIQQQNVARAKMIDLTQDILARFSGKKLEEHIFGNEGGNSVEYLRSILHPGSNLHHESDHSRFPDLLSRYGPALVAQFHVHNDFSGNGEMRHYRGSPKGDFIGRHAMVMVGRAKNVTGQCSFCSKTGG